MACTRHSIGIVLPIPVRARFLVASKALLTELLDFRVRWRGVARDRDCLAVPSSEITDGPSELTARPARAGTSIGFSDLARARQAHAERTSERRIKNQKGVPVAMSRSVPRFARYVENGAVPDSAFRGDQTCRGLWLACRVPAP